MNLLRARRVRLSRTLFSLSLVGSGLLVSATTGCKSGSSPTAAPIVNNAVAADTGGPDPADANLAGGAPAAASGGSSSQRPPTHVLGQSSTYTPQQQGESYQAGQQAPAPIVRGNPEPAPDYSQYGAQNGAQNGAQYGAQNGAQNGAPAGGSNGGYDQGYSDGESAGQAIAEADQPPPPLPVYDQPPAPDPNDIWTPGYWGYGGGGYYWIPGVWVAAPYYGALWTPPYWGWYGNRYRFHHGYWGPHIGFYGGVNYGFGYIGTGYYGGYWRGHDFFYNRAVSRVGPSFRTVYERPVVVNNITYNTTYNNQQINRVSYNGGRGGVAAQPRPAELAAMRESHTPPLAAQVAVRQQAATDRGNFYAENHGRPAQAAFARPPLTAAGTGTGARPGAGSGPGPVPGKGAARPGAPGSVPAAGGGFGNNPTRTEGRPPLQGQPGAMAMPARGPEGLPRNGTSVQPRVNSPSVQQPGALQPGVQQPGLRTGQQPPRTPPQPQGSAAQPQGNPGQQQVRPTDQQRSFERPSRAGNAAPQPGTGNTVPSSPATTQAPAQVQHRIATGPVTQAQPTVTAPRPAPPAAAAPRPAAPRTAPAAAAPVPRVETSAPRASPAATPAPAPRVETPERPAPAVAAPHAAPPPRPAPAAAAPHAEAPHPEAGRPH